MSDHVFRYRNQVVVLAIVNLKLEPDKVGQDRRRAGLRSHGRDLLAGKLGPDNGEAVARLVGSDWRSGFGFFSAGGRLLTGRGSGL